MPSKHPAIELQGLTKAFGSIVANQDIDLTVFSGEILALLYSVQPVPVEIRTITNSLLESNMVSVPSIAQHIDYLSGKKYIQVIGEDAAEQILHGVVPPSAFVKLTPTGVDLVEGTIEDQGVDV